MTLLKTLNTLQHKYPVSLHMDSGTRLEEFSGKQLVGVLLLDRDNGSINVTYDGNGRNASYDFKTDDGLVWDCHKVEYGKESEDVEISLINMQVGLESLKKLGMKNGSLMQRALCGIAMQYGKAVPLKDINEAGAELGPMPEPPKTDNIFSDDLDRYGDEIAKRIAQSEDRAFMKVALRRANLSISKDGKVVDLKPTQLQNQGGRD